MSNVIDITRFRRKDKSAGLIQSQSPIQPSPDTPQPPLEPGIGEYIFLGASILSFILLPFMLYLLFTLRP